MNVYTWVEITSVALSLLFLLLLIRNNKWCWPFGIVGSALGAFLFVWPEAEVKLYSEAILYSYYVWIGIYGWIKWERDEENSTEIKQWSGKQHFFAIVIGAVTAPILGFLMDHLFSSNNPYIDASTTVFSFIASYMQAQRVLSSWHFWIIINAVSIWLYFDRGLEIYTGLMVVYFALSIIGLLKWRKAILSQ